MADAPPSATAVTTVAVVVTHHPDLVRLRAQFDALLPQVAHIVVVDNGNDAGLVRWLAQWPAASVHRLLPAGNRGLAAAQNEGVDWARSVGASHVLLMDHDSVPAPGMVRLLLEALGRHPDAAAVGPFHRDSRQPQARSPFVRTRGCLTTHLGCDASNPVVEVDYLIASGCLVPMSVLLAVGPMRDDFFIDFVDVEWCFRARHSGRRVYGVCAARMDHRLGDAPVHFLGRTFTAHSPQRHYFHVRNALRLYRQPWVPSGWKMVSAWRLLLKCGFHMLVTRPRWAYLQQTWRGLADGLACTHSNLPS